MRAGRATGKMWGVVHPQTGGYFSGGSVMSAALAALFQDHAAAAKARTMLVRDGSPTDRVALTSERAPGNADMAPSEEPPSRLTEYFGQVLSFENERAEVRTRNS
jgi:hypothetical protein